VKWISRGRYRGLKAIGLATVALCLFSASAAFGVAGTATVVQSNGTTPLNSGGSQTSWTLKLPTGAACSKDTASGQYHVNSYLVNAGTVSDPSTLSFTSTGPSQGFPLVDTTGSAYTAQNTAINTGQVPQPPTFNYAVFSIDGRNGTQTLPVGTYNEGIACSTNSGAMDNFWNVQIVIQASAGDPNGETWSVSSSSSVPESRFVVLLPLSAALLLGTGVVILRRRHSHEATAMEA
jgi:hypothetical protein